MGRVTRSLGGVGDTIFLSRYTAYALDRKGSTIRIAPFEVPDLALLNEVLHGSGTPRFVGRAVFSVPINRPNLALLRNVGETVGERLWPWFGAYYVVAAEKQ